jgi:hypothetical protein
MTCVLVCELDVEPAELVGGFVYVTWPCELEDESPIYFHGKAVPEVKAEGDAGSCCVGIAVDAASLHPTPLCSVSVRVDGTCTLLRSEFERLHDLPIVTGENVRLANGLTVVVLVVDTLRLLVHVSRSGC